MFLVYRTLNCEDEHVENCLPLASNLPFPTVWSEVRRRSRGLIGPNESCFVWNGEHWEVVSSDTHPLIFCEEGCFIRVCLLPRDFGGHFQLTKSRPTTTPTTASSSHASTAAKPKKLEESISQVTDSLKSSLTFASSFLQKAANSASESVIKAVNESSATTDQVGSIKFRLGKKIAEGGFSQVFLATTVVTPSTTNATNSQPQLLAIKKCLAQTSEQLDQLKREIAVHDACQKCPFILNLLESEVTPVDGRHMFQVRFVFPLCEQGSWFDCFASKSVEENLLRIFLGASKGLQFLHSKQFLHRDVKPHNILLRANGDPLLMDLGSACTFPILIKNRTVAIDLQEEAAQNCSAPYRAPELFDPAVGASIGPEVDVWSLGGTLFAALFGKGYSPFEDAHQGVLKLAILNGSPVRFPSSLSNTPHLELAKRIISQSVVHGPRMSLDEIIRLLEEAT